MKYDNNGHFFHDFYLTGITVDYTIRNPYGINCNLTWMCRMNAVAIQRCTTFKSKDSVQAKSISWKIGVMCDDGTEHYENVMSNQDVHEMAPSSLIGLLKNQYSEIINIFACESDNVNF